MNTFLYSAATNYFAMPSVQCAINSFWRPRRANVAGGLGSRVRMLADQHPTCNLFLAQYGL